MLHFCVAAVLRILLAPRELSFLASPVCRRAACLITDVQMPGMSGLDLQHHLRTAGNRVPVILMTAFPQDHVRRRAEECGALGFFAKPFEGRALIDCVAQALRGETPSRDGV